MSTFEDEALDILRRAAQDTRVNGYPPGIHFRHDLAELVRDARKDAGYRVALAIAEAWELFLEDGDPTILWETLDGELPPGFAVRRPVTTRIVRTAA